MTEPTILNTPPSGMPPTEPRQPGSPSVDAIGDADGGVSQLVKELATVKAELAKLKEALPVSTSPPSSAPPAPAAGVVSSASMKWQALRAAGRSGEAEAFYRANRSAIIRGE
jgi:hypothetical protein